MRNAVLIVGAIEGLLVGGAVWWMLTVAFARAVLVRYPLRGWEGEPLSEDTHAICVTFLLFPIALIGGAWAGVKVARRLLPADPAEADAKRGPVSGSG